AQRVEAGLGTVGPARTWLEFEQALSETRDVVGEGVSGLSRQPTAADAVVAHRPAREAGYVRQQIANRDLTFSRHGVVTELRRFVGTWRRPLARLRDGDLEVLERGNVLRHWIRDAEFAFLHHHHDGDAGDRLRHRRDAEHRVFRHRLLRFGV